MNKNIRFRILIHCAFKDGHMMENDIPRIVMDGFTSPFDALNYIREEYQEKKGCLHDNALSYFPKKVGEMPWLMLQGERGCRCKLFVEMYEVKKK